MNGENVISNTISDLWRSIPNKESQGWSCKSGEKLMVEEKGEQGPRDKP